MIRHLLVVLTLTALPLAGLAAPKTISGTVRDAATKQPLALVTISSSQAKAPVQSTSSGVWEVELDDRTATDSWITIRATKSGYEPYLERLANPQRTRHVIDLKPVGPPERRTTPKAAPKRPPVAGARSPGDVAAKKPTKRGKPLRPAVSASGLSVRRITDLGDVGSAVVAPDGKTMFVTRFASVDVTDVSGATPRKLFDTFYGSIACAPSNCYFGGAINDQLGVYRFKIGESPRLMFSGWAEGLDVNRTGDRLLLQRRGREGQSTEIVVRRVDADAQTVERSSDRLHDASWHPDGKSILYLQYFKEAVVLQDLASGKQTNIPTAAGATVVSVAWETRGTYVLAYTTTQTAGEFWILRPDGQPVGPILRDEEKVRYGGLRTTPLPNTFSAVRSEEHTFSGVASLERQADERLIGRPNIRGPFSWLGPERLLYTAKDDTSSWIAEYDIYAQQDRRLSPTGLISNPAIAPDGTRLVFEMQRDAESGLWTSPVEHWNPVKLTELPILAHAISPDSKWVAFAAFGEKGGLYVTPLEGGGEVRRLARGSIWQVSFAGTQTLVFGRWSDGRQPLCKISRDGGSESCFALDDTQRFVMSPDGKTIAAVTHAAGSRTQLHFIDIASGVVGKVVAIPSWINTGGGIAWTADGARLVYATSTSHSTTAIESYRIADGANEVIIKSAEGQITNITTSPDGRYATFQRRSGWSDAVLLTVTP